MNGNSDRPIRESVPEAVELPVDPEEIARNEARNTLRQFDAVADLVESALKSEDRFRLRPSTVLELNRMAIEGVNKYAGVYRPHEIEIKGSQHKPPPRHRVPRLVEEMCDHVNDKWDSAPPIHLAAYLLWRVNWIHPFSDGNGRTARALGYAVLAIRLGYLLPGSRSIPEQISENKFPYYDALEAADTAWSNGKIDLAQLEKMLSEMLAAQLLRLHEQATGGARPGRPR